MGIWWQVQRQTITLAGPDNLFGAYMIGRIVCDGTLRTLGWPAGWKRVGSAAPANIAASKTGLLRLWSFGTNEADVIAQWAVEVQTCAEFYFRRMIRITITTAHRTIRVMSHQ